MNKHKRGFTSRRHPELDSGSSRIFNKGFTLLEVLVVVLIIGVLAAVALPQYQKAVLKSRYSALMPIGKAIAEGNEVYYMEHGAYASLPTQLDVSGQSDKYPDGTQVSMPQEEESLSYVLVTNDNVDNARYLVYQKHSPSFAGTTMCEAGDDKANELCIALGGVTLPSGGNSLGNADWTAYLLSGDATGSSFCPAGATCNSEGQVTQCPSGKTLKEGGCVTCDIEHAAGCSTTSYTATSCESGYYVKEGACAAYDYGGNRVCINDSYSEGGCHLESTFGDNATCGENGSCRNSFFYDKSTCNSTVAYLPAHCQHSTFSGDSACIKGECSGATFTENASCMTGGDCREATLSGNATCDGGNCSAATFTENASCVGNSVCHKAIFSGNSICASTEPNGGCSSPYSRNDTSTFTENAVCAGTGCNIANYEGNACCAGTSCPVGVQKCVYNSATGTYDRVGVW